MPSSESHGFPKVLRGKGQGARGKVANQALALPAHPILRRDQALRLLETLKLGGAACKSAVWTHEDIAAVLPAAVQEGAEIWLYRRLAELGVLSDSEIVRRIRPLAQSGAVRWMHVDEQTEHVIRVFTQHGFPFMLIKGPARRAAACRYPYADARKTADVDVLVPHEVGRAAWQALVGCGYEPAIATEDVPPVPHPHPHPFHFAPIWDKRRVAVEVHVSTAPWIEPAEAWRRATTGADLVAWNGHDLRVPDATELTWQGLTNAFADGPIAAYRLRAFLDVAAILASRPAVDWSEIRARIAAGEVRETGWHNEPLAVPSATVNRWLTAAAELAGVILPPELSSDGAVSLARTIRWRALVGRMTSRRLRDWLLDAGLRREAEMDDANRATSAGRRVRQHVSGRLGRLAYVTWRKSLRD